MEVKIGLQEVIRAEVKIHAADEIDEEIMEKFCLDLETAMNRHRIFKLEAYLNPYQKGISIITDGK